MKTLASIGTVILLITLLSHPAAAWHNALVVLASMTFIGAGLVGLCYALKPERKLGYAIIDWGYWGSFVIVVFCVLHGARPAVAAPSSHSSQPSPAATAPCHVIAVELTPSGQKTICGP